MYLFIYVFQKLLDLAGCGHFLSLSVKGLLKHVEHTSGSSLSLSGSFSLHLKHI